MSPTVRHDPAPFDLDAVISGAVPNRARIYACALLALALIAAGVLIATGAAMPGSGLLLVCAVPLALCMNRYLVFPNEVGVTADAAVLFAAMVAFRGDAQWLGPMVLALLAGPLDMRHWGTRAFTRMAYNSGSTALVVGAGLAVYVPLAHSLGTGWEATLGAAAVAAVAYVVAESVLGVALVMLLGERARDAARHQLPLNAIALPLAILGAAAGLAAVGVGDWLTFLLLLPVPFVPELAFVVAPRRTSVTVRWIAPAVAALIASIALSGSTARAAAGLVALACLVFADRRPTTTRARWLPPLLALCATGAIGAFSIGLPGPTVTIAVAAVTGLLVLVALAGPTIAVWTAPAVLVAAVAARGWAVCGRFGALAFVAAVVAALVVAATFGPPPWPSRLLAMVPTRPSPVVAAALGVVTTAGALSATLAAGAPHRHLAVVTAYSLEVAVAAGAFAVHFWRFRPRRRACELVALLVVGGTGVLVVTELAPVAAVVAAASTWWIARASMPART
jgi:hypothetical protein